MICVVLNVHTSSGQSQINEWVSQAVAQGFSLYGALRLHWNNQKYSPYTKESI
jgi:Cft2 family RNA processing exonuclease